MMIYQFLEERANAAVDEDDHLLILICFRRSQIWRFKVWEEERQSMEDHASMYAKEPTYTPRGFSPMM
jgi:hypothetical protein